MNNKGFAITGIIYTLFILFLMILLSVLSGLNISKNMMKSSTETLENSLSGTEIEESKVTEIANSGIAPYFGKYIFTISSQPDYECTAYLDKGTNFKTEDITWIPKDCNDYDNIEMTLKKIYNFEEWS